MTIPTVEPQLKQLIERCLDLEYTSMSHDGIETGNHYQSILLRNTRTDGFRQPRSKLLDRINFQSKTVLDLGSNLGELSRAARARGASLVDGYETDPFFLEVARLINAYNGATRVSFFERDITDPSSYAERYDIVLAFAVFHYVSRVLNKIADVTDVFLVETHSLEGNLQDHYVEPVTRFFPAHSILGESDWGRSLDSSAGRAVVLFAKDDRLLEGALHGSVESTKKFS